MILGKGKLLQKVVGHRDHWQFPQLASVYMLYELYLNEMNKFVWHKLITSYPSPARLRQSQPSLRVSHWALGNTLMSAFHSKKIRIA